MFGKNNKKRSFFEKLTGVAPADDFDDFDFEERDDLALELQAKLRLVLRRLNYPETHREVVIDNIFDFVIQGESSP